MKRMLLLALFLSAGLGLLVGQTASAKGHVPTHKVQACHKGTTITVGEDALAGHQGHGDGQLPACDFNNIFHTGDACPADTDGNGRVEGAELPNPRSDAETPACVGNVF
jgi:hypothetical protein